jgi:transaldolase
MTNHILEIEALGQSIWMDNLSRDIIQSGALAEMIRAQGICGITSNPAIFEKAIAGNAVYDKDIEAGSRSQKSTLEIYESLVFEDIQNACDIFLPVYEQTKGWDGYVSLEVPPTIANDTESTIREARRYFNTLKRPNLMIKIPGTPEGLPAVELAIKDGINVNVTLLFSVQSYVETAWAYIRGLEARVAEGLPVDNISSVASFFLSRIDSKVDDMLETRIKGTDPSRTELVQKLNGMKGKVAIANAKLAYAEYQKIIQSDRWKALSAKGARVQRLLWASTGTKNPAYSDVMYVDELVGPDTVNTLPPSTIEACVDHCSAANRITENLEQAQAVINSLNDPDVYIDLDQVMADLLEDGIEKFVQPFDSLMGSLQAKAESLTAVLQ